MNTGTAVTLGITIASALIGLIVKVASLSITLGKLIQKVEAAELRTKEDRDNDHEKFSELYNRVNSHDMGLATLTQAVQNMSDIVSKMDAKLDRLIEERHCGTRQTE